MAAKFFDEMWLPNKILPHPFKDNFISAKTGNGAVV